MKNKVIKKILPILVIILVSVPSFSYANKWHIKMKKKEKKDYAHYVLKAQLDNQMVFNLRNIKNPDIYKFFNEYEDYLGVKEKGIEFIIEPYTRFEGQPGEQATMFFMDPAGNALEFKSFKDFNQIFAT